MVLELEYKTSGDDTIGKRDAKLLKDFQQSN